MMLNNEVIDLRSALELLQSIDGQLVETNVEVDPLLFFSKVLEKRLEYPYGKVVVKNLNFKQ